MRVQLGSDSIQNYNLIFSTFKILPTCFCQDVSLLAIIYLFILERKKMNLGNNLEIGYDRSHKPYACI
jgi:hypothetical protein